jgi:hypothetical protein
VPLEVGFPRFSTPSSTTKMAGEGVRLLASVQITGMSSQAVDPTMISTPGVKRLRLPNDS